MQIVRLDKRFIKQLVLLHISDLPGTASALGESYMINFYQQIFAGKQHIVLGAIYKKQLAGFVIATKDIQTLFANTHPDTSLYAYVLIVQKVLSGKISLNTIVERILFEREVRKSIKIYEGYIFILVVGRTFQRKGIGKQLVAKTEQLLKTPLWVDTKVTNTTAVSFYTALGFTEKKRCFENILFVKK